MINETGAPMANATAVARHIEWLEFALAAARDEETRRRGRLERSTDKNRQKRTDRLAEVTAEVRELDALVKGLKDLQARAVLSTAKPRATVARKPKAAARPKATGTAKPRAIAAKPATAAKAQMNGGAAAKPTTAAKRGARRATKPPSSSA
jgi:hypothetical protein